MQLDYLEVGLGVAKGNDPFLAGLAAAQQAFSKLSIYEPSVALIYASTNYDLQKVLDGITSLTKNIPLLGTSTGGEEINGLITESDVITVVLLASPYLRVHTGIGQQLEKNCERAVEEAFRQAHVDEYLSHQNLSGQLKVSYVNPYKSIFALTFLPGKVNGYNAKGFEVANLLRKKSGNKLPIFGACSSNTDINTPTYQLFNGKVYTDSLVLGLFETDLKFGIGKAHGFIPTENHMVVTRAKDYIIKELDYRPAAEVYAAAYNISLRELKANPEQYFQSRPLGIRDLHGSYYLVDCYRVTEENSIELHMPIQENTLLTMMESNVQRIINSEQKSINKALLHGEVNNPALVLLHSCIIRKKILGDQKKDCIGLITEKLRNTSVAGFYSYGEQGISEEGIPLYFNGTAVALAIGNELNPVSAMVLNNISLYEEISALYKVSTTLNSTLQLEETLDKTVGLIKCVMKVEECSLFFTREETASLSLQTTTSTSSSEIMLALLQEAGRLAVQKKGPIISQYTGEVKSVLAVPITVKGETIGVVVVTSKKNSYFSEREISFLFALANQAGIAIENARLYRMMEYSATTDGLTGLYNHRYFQVRLEEEITRAKRWESKLSLLILDIDYFKSYNDQNGHPQGDEILKVVAEILNKNIRSIDVASRYGGEEFTIILPETTGENALSVAERIRQNVESINFLGLENQPNGRITVSIGVATYPIDAASKEDLIKRADQALYHAKYQGRNTVYLYKRDWI